LGKVPPNEFIPLIQEMDCINQLTIFMLQQVAQYLKQWKRQQQPTIAINTTYQALNEAGFEEQLFAIISQNELAPPTAFSWN